MAQLGLGQLNYSNLTVLIRIQISLTLQGRSNPVTICFHRFRQKENPAEIISEVSSSWELGQVFGFDVADSFCCGAVEKQQVTGKVLVLVYFDD